MKGKVYRVFSRLIHRYGFHYAPSRPMPQPHRTRLGIDGKPVIERSHWCQWCGLRGTTTAPDGEKE